MGNEKRAADKDTYFSNLAISRLEQLRDGLSKEVIELAAELAKKRFEVAKTPDDTVTVDDLESAWNRVMELHGMHPI